MFLFLLRPRSNPGESRLPAPILLSPSLFSDLLLQRKLSLSMTKGGRKPARKPESSEARIARLEDELRDAIHKNDALKKESSRDKEDLERRICRLKEDMAGEAKRMENDRKEARRARDELRKALAKKDKEIERTKNQVIDCKGKLNASYTELGKLRAQLASEAVPALVDERPSSSHKMASRPAARSAIKIKTESLEASQLKRPIIYHAQSSSDEEGGDFKRRKVESSAKNSASIISSTSSIGAPPQSLKSPKASNVPERKRKEKPSKDPIKDGAPRSTSVKHHLSATGIPVVISAHPSSLSALQQRIAAVTTFGVRLSSKVSPMGVSRTFLVKTYGISGSMASTIKPEMNVPRGTMRRLILPRPEFNPGLPSSPGAPGTVLTNRSDILECGPVSLWIQAIPGEGLWKYFGNYDLARSVQPLTAAEARGLDKNTVRVWAESLSSNVWDCHAELRVRIWFRKIGAEATESAIARHIELLRNKKSPIDLNKNDIVEALGSWQETLHVVTIRCVGYDYDFLADVESRWRERHATACSSPSSSLSVPPPSSSIPTHPSNSASMAQDKPPAHTVEVLEGHITHLENELRYVIHANDTLKMQLAREKEGFERQIARMREDMFREVRRLEFDLKGACRTRDELRTVIAEKETETEKVRDMQTAEEPASARPKKPVVETQPAKEVQPVAPIVVKTESPSPEPLPQKRRIKVGQQSRQGESSRHHASFDGLKFVHALPQNDALAIPPKGSEHRTNSNDEDVGHQVELLNPGSGLHLQDQQGSAESANKKRSKKPVKSKSVTFASPSALAPGVPAVVTTPSALLLALQKRVAGVTTFDVQLPNKASSLASRVLSS
ncbi:hypothetical protein EVG20_g4870 [Dentipellis fragilis]|uniref:DUF6697 domain-containing protein n=1 Tax=Dentipellis fragilis TaxID=205917 RepID=A0A4Y9YYL6_9AGAM|nr:hypothetical protein EVG20_g4870 [Dentipellis fragilis]